MALFRKSEPLAPARTLSAKAASRTAANTPASRTALFAPRSPAAWSPAEMRLCRAMRASVPVIDAAVSRLVRLCGGFKPRTGDDALDRELDSWAKRLNVGCGGVGLDAFLDSYLDSLLVCGRAVGEIVPNESGRGVAAVLCADPALVEPENPLNPLAFKLRGVGKGGRRFALEQDGLLLFTPLAPDIPQQTETSCKPAQPVTDTPEQPEPSCESAAPAAHAPEQPEAPYSPAKHTTHAAEQGDPPYEPETPVTHTPAQPEPERTEGNAARSVRAPTPPDTSSAPNTAATEQSPAAPQQRTHARPEPSPPQQPGTPATPYPGEVAGSSPAAERRRPNRAAPSTPQPRSVPLGVLTRTLDRELRRYG